VSAAHKALREARESGLSRLAPRLTGVQAEGAAPLATAWRAGRDEVVAAKAETVATAIRIGSPVNAAKALRAVRETGGAFAAASDDEILAAQRRMAASEGLFVEPASAAPLAGLRKLVDEGVVARSESVVLVATGNGLKDPDVVQRFGTRPERVEPTIAALRRLVAT
jgi:threonine synthase